MTIWSVVIMWNLGEARNQDCHFTSPKCAESVVPVYRSHFDYVPVSVGDRLWTGDCAALVAEHKRPGKRHVTTSE